MIAWSIIAGALSLGAAFAAALLCPPRWGALRRLGAGLGLGGAVALSLGVERTPQVDQELEQMLPARGLDAEHAGSQACKSCHPAQHQSWASAWHSKMTQVATPQTVLAPFDGRILRKGSVWWRVTQEQGQLYAEEIDPKTLQVIERARVYMTTGSHQLQAYWIEGDDERLEQLAFVYLVREGRWLANDDSFLHPDPGPDQAEILPSWSDGCVNCHTTGPQLYLAPEGKNQDERAVVELGIGCESCHGAGGAHALAQRDPLTRYKAHLSDDEAAKVAGIINPGKLDHELANAVCGRCHSQTTLERARSPEQLLSFKPGDRYESYFDVNGLAQLYDVASRAYGERELTQGERDALGSMWPDHAVRIAGREYNATTASACSQRGQLSCMSCHSMHSVGAQGQDKHLKPGHEGQAACIGCHQDIASAGQAHTHHAPDSPGADCLNCHMPYASYGLLKATRIHLIDSPKASGAGSRDRPNACNLCHLDQTLAWTATHLNTWYQQPQPALKPDHQQLAAGALWMLSGDAVQRAVAAWHISWTPSKQATGGGLGLAPIAAHLLDDPYAAVRHQAARALEELAPFGDHAWVSAPPERRAADQALALDRWRALGLTANPALLQPAKGQLDEAKIKALIEQRDQLPISVAE